MASITDKRRLVQLTARNEQCCESSIHSQQQTFIVLVVFTQKDSRSQKPGHGRCAEAVKVLALRIVPGVVCDGGAVTLSIVSAFIL